ncbi:MAG TPA: hypothetical protein VND19_22990 [Acetobacteraceae bacterium]|nr:hypothetical protein [Acetobacteraceae bacterium]
MAITAPLFRAVPEGSPGPVDIVHHVPIGYVPQSTRIAPVPAQDIGVLFYGSVTPRRAGLDGGAARPGAAPVSQTRPLSA